MNLIPEDAESEGHAPRDGRSLEEQCSDFCAGSPFFGLWSGGDRRCRCYPRCDRVRNFAHGEMARNFQNVMYERQPDWTVGAWTQCSVTCGEGIQTREVSCNHVGGCTGVRPVTERRCAREVCPD